MEQIKATRLTLRAKEVAKLTGLSLKAVYELAKRGEWESVKVGGSVLIKRKSLLERLGMPDDTEVDTG